MSCTARLYDGLTGDTGTLMRQMAMPYGFILRRFTPSDPLYDLARPKGTPRYGLTVFNRRYEELFSVRLRRKPTKKMLLSVAAKQENNEWEQIDRFNAGRDDMVQLHLHHGGERPFVERGGSSEEDADYTRRLRKFLGWKVEAPQKSNVVWPSVEQIESGERKLRARVG